VVVVVDGIKENVVEYPTCHYYLTDLQG
jgi:hypothetical protein